MESGQLPARPAQPAALLLTRLLAQGERWRWGKTTPTRSRYFSYSAPNSPIIVPTGVITESKCGRQAILAQRVVDATGDGDVAARAGAPFRIDPKDTLEGATVNFGCSGIDLGLSHPLAKGLR